MKRTTMIALKNFYRVPSVFYKLHRYTKYPDKYSDEKKLKILNTLVDATMKSGNINIEVYGRENLPEDPSFIFTPNHQGLYDGFAMQYAYNKLYTPIIKKELNEIPIINNIFGTMGAIALDRESPRQAVGVLKETIRLVKSGRTCLIFPEGTRSKNGNVVGEFKGGSFKAAYSAKCPIVPVAFIDSYIPFDVKNCKPVTVKVVILEAIMYEDYKDISSNDLALLVQNKIQDTINEYKNNEEK